LSKNTPDDWYRALKQAIEMPEEQFNKIRRSMLQDVKENSTEVGHIDLYEAAWRSNEFHFLTRNKRGEDGRPIIVYFVTAQNLNEFAPRILRFCNSVKNYGIRPVVIYLKGDTLFQFDFENLLSTSEIEFVTLPENSDNSILFHLLKKYSPVLVHSFGYYSWLGDVAATINTPIVGSFYKDNTPFPEKLGSTNFSIIHSDCLAAANKMARFFNGRAYYCSEPVPEECFIEGLKRAFENFEPAAPSDTHILYKDVMSPLKFQKEIIQAVSILRKDGYSTFLDLVATSTPAPTPYLLECQKLIQDENLEAWVHIHSNPTSTDDYLNNTDIIVNLSTDDGMPIHLKDAMASGIAVVTVSSPEINEYLMDGFSGFHCAKPIAPELVLSLKRLLDHPEQRTVILKQAREIARGRFHPYFAINQILQMYLSAIKSTQAFVAAGETRITEKSISNTLRTPSKITTSGQPQNARYMGRKITYPYKAFHRNWCGLNLFVGTYGKNPHGILTLRIMNNQHTILREEKANLGNVVDNSWVGFNFEPILNAQGREFLIELSLDRNWLSNRIAIYESNPRSPKIIRILNRIQGALGIPMKNSNLYCSELYLR
jgi:glycosyltransferase involved in cell wall biosynthesis